MAEPRPQRERPDALSAQPSAGPAESPLSVERLEELLEAQLGLDCVDWQRARLAELAHVIAQRQRRRESASAHTDGSGAPSASSPLTPSDLQILIDHVSVGETYFFREPSQFAALTDKVIWERLTAHRNDLGRPVRILSAGCASGEEAYSLAIALRDHRAEFAAGRLAVVGIDVHAAALDKARRARYSDWSLRNTPAALRQECFHREGDQYRLRDEHRFAVHFAEHNLLEPEPDFFYPGAFDIIFCRNVLIYFSERSLRFAVARLAEALAPGGYLFLGHSETLRGISDAFQSCQSHEAFYYRKKESAEPPPPVVTRHPAPFVEAIQRATDRVARLAAEHPLPAAGPPTDSARAALPTTEWSALMPILELIAAEKFAAALALLEGLPGGAPAHARGPAMTLAAAAIYCGQGRFTESQRACQRLLDQAVFTPEAHYLMALASEHLADLERARRSYQEAVRSAPRFAMARLRLGALLRRAGLREPACSELRQAVELLSHEPRERILLFGGGFQRDALIALGRAELQSMGAEP